MLGEGSSLPIQGVSINWNKKCNDTKKAERFFKERGIKYQFIDMKEKGMSKGELTSVAGSNHRKQEYLESHFTEVAGMPVCMVDIKGAPLTFDFLRAESGIVFHGKDITVT